MRNLKLLKMIAEGEHQRQDFKFCINDSRKIARSMVAFANTDGGRLLLGVRDNGSIAGVKSDEEFYMAQAAASMYSSPSIDFEVQQYLIEGKSVLELVIKKSVGKLHRAQNEEGRWMVYLRKDDENILAPGIFLKVWEQRQKTSGVTINYTDAERKLLTVFSQHSDHSQYQTKITDHLAKESNPSINMNSYSSQLHGGEVENSPAEFKDGEALLSMSQILRYSKLPRRKCEALMVKLIAIGVIELEICPSGPRFFLCKNF